MNKSPSLELLDAIEQAPSSAAGDKLDAIRREAAAARDLGAQIEDLESRLKELKSWQSDVLTRKLPEMMDEVGVRDFTLEAAGNLPAMKLKMSTIYSAGITSKWSAEKRRAAFDWLDANGHGDLIKTEVSVAFPREERSEARKLKSHLIDDFDFSVELSEAVNSKTLSSWLKEVVESGQDVPPLDVIGGYIGRIVKVEKLDE